MRKAKRAACVLAVCAATLVGIGAVPALADEAHGQGRSICHFSGLNDDPDAPFPEGGRVQSYGQLVRQGLKDVVPSPGFACNPNNHFGE
jgi:hypothetical protein